ncbi:MAG TPA: hypothetical protein DCM32_01570 [Xanthomonadaceae bacterium]|jgi:prepilin-type N-terminal cleavage/methylation domain-containing protein|nr:hypothetical protein [Xanthomonadaceae bacterium]
MRGFTLIEMLVVLVILGMAAALVAPALARTAERVRESGEREDVRRLLQAMPALARQQGHALVWDAGMPMALPGRDWPEGWQVVALSPIRIAANGWCSGGELQARGGETTMHFAVNAPDCRLVLRDDVP